MTSPQRSDSLRGILWMTQAALWFAISIALVRYLSDYMSVLQITFLRQVLGALTMLPLVMKSGIGPFRTQQPWTHFGRGAFSYLGMLLSYFSVTLISLADSNALQFTLPFFTFLYAMWLLNERISIHRWVAMAAGFIGVLVIVRPGFAQVNVGAFVAIAAAASYGLSDVMTRLLSRDDRTNLIMFYTFAMPIPLALVLAVFNWTWPDWWVWAVILVFSMASTLASYALTRAFSVAETSVVSPVLYLRLPMVAVLGWYFFGQPTDIWTWIGSVIIFGATYGLARREAHVARRAARPA
jgi:drug/metabolite transporter (DMT)-like permease